jgi:hypothetical protein
MALNMEATASSGSDIDAKDLLANKVNAAGSSGATISVHPIVSLKAKASSGILTIILPQNQSKKIEFWSKYRQDLTFYLTINN